MQVHTRAVIKMVIVPVLLPILTRVIGGLRVNRLPGPGAGVKALAPAINPLIKIINIAALLLVPLL